MFICAQKRGRRDHLWLALIAAEHTYSRAEKREGYVQDIGCFSCTMAVDGMATGIWVGRLIAFISDLQRRRVDGSGMISLKTRGPNYSFGMRYMLMSSKCASSLLDRWYSASSLLICFLIHLPTCPQVGDIVVGQVVQYEQVGALVDIGGKSSALLAPAEASMQRVDDLEDFMMIGDHREFQVCKRCLSKLTPTVMKGFIKRVGRTEVERHRGVNRLPYPNLFLLLCPIYVSLYYNITQQIIGGEDENGQVKLSIRRLEFARAWERVRQIQVDINIIF
jgi:predicted RNA-binding protein with RPS1 domain